MYAITDDTQPIWLCYTMENHEDRTMSSFTITIEIPEELVERAKKVGVQLEANVEPILALLEDEVRRREAGQRLREIGEQLQALPPELKPTPEEIEAEIRAYWAEKSAKDDADP